MVDGTALCKEKSKEHIVLYVYSYFAYVLGKQELCLLWTTNHVKNISCTSTFNVGMESPVPNMSD